MPIDVVPFETLSAARLAAADLAPRTPLLPPLLQRESLTLLLGPRGIGKSFTALGIARGVAAGESFLGWTPPVAFKVTYVDGELAGVDLQQRLKSFGVPPDKLEFVIRGIRGHRIPDLASDEGWQALFQPWRAALSPNLLVLDSLSSLTGGNGREAANWPLVRRMLFNLRAVGIAVLLVHSGSASGIARGPRQREDLFDTILSLRRPDDYRAGDGLRYELHFEKARGLHGTDALPFEVRLEIDGDGQARWHRRPVGSAELHRVAQLLNEGLNSLQVAKRLGFSKSKAYRLEAAALRTGLLASPSQAA